MGRRENPRDFTLRTSNRFLQQRVEREGTLGDHVALAAARRRFGRGRDPGRCRDGGRRQLVVGIRREAPAESPTPAGRVLTAAAPVFGRVTPGSAPPALARLPWPRLRLAGRCRRGRRLERAAPAAGGGREGDQAEEDEGTGTEHGRDPDNEEAWRRHHSGPHPARRARPSQPVRDSLRGRLARHSSVAVKAALEGGPEECGDGSGRPAGSLSDTKPRRKAPMGRWNGDRFARQFLHQRLSLSPILASAPVASVSVP